MIKKLLLALCLLNLSLVTLTSADDTYWDSNLVRKYVHNSELQRRWAWAFLASNLRQLKGDERILDIGCGDGKITADIAKFVPQGLVVGIDPSLPMLDWAKKQYSKLEYPNLEFLEGGFLQPNTIEKFDLIVANCSFQHCLNQPKALDSASKLLTPGGKLLIMIPTIDNPAWKQARKNIQSLPKWSGYWLNILPRKFPTPDECLTMLRDAGFQPTRVEKVKTADPFFDRDDLLDFLVGTFTPAVPQNLEREFYGEWVDEYIRLLPEVQSADGVIEIRLGRMEIEAINAI